VANNAVVAESVVAIVTRHNNPKNIRGWDDLTRSVFVPQDPKLDGALALCSTTVPWLASSQLPQLVAFGMPWRKGQDVVVYA